MDFDFIVVGSGFGGSVAAHRLAEKGYRVAVMEMGRRWTRGGSAAHQLAVLALDLAAEAGAARVLQHRAVPPRHDPAWLRGRRRLDHLCQHAARARRRGVGQRLMGGPGGLEGRNAARTTRTAMRMLGVIENRILGAADHMLQRAAAAIGMEGTFYRTRVAVFEAKEGEAGGVEHPDPYFGGEGPERATCIGCGGCMMGCRYNAKNTLDKNYLYLAEKHGARVFPETRVVDVRPAARPAGWQRRLRSAHRQVDRVAFAQEPRRFTCRGVVFAASALGTMDLLFRLKRTRLAAGCQRLPGQPGADQRRVADRRACAAQPRGPVEGDRDRLGRLHRRAHAHRGHALSRRVGRHGVARDVVDRRRARPHAHSTLAQNPGRRTAAPSPAHHSLPASFRVGAGVADSPVHAVPRLSHRDAARPAVVLALSQNADEPRQAASPRSFPAPMSSRRLPLG